MRPSHEGLAEASGSNKAGAGGLRRQVLWSAARLLMSAVALAFIFSKFSPHAAIIQLGDRFIPMLMAGTLLTLVSLAFNAARWTVVSSAIDAPLAPREAGILTLIGHFLSQALPTSVGGDLIRAWGAWRAGVDFQRAILGVLIERLVGLGVLCVLVLVGLVILAQRFANGGLILAAGLVLAGVVAGVVVLVNLDRLPARLVRGRIRSGLDNLSKSAKQLLAKPVAAVLACILSLLVHTTLMLMTTMFARFYGVQLHPLDALTIVPAVLVMSNLPISVGGWGVREVGFLGGFMLLGLPGEGAIAISVMIGLVNLTAALPGAILFVLRRHWDSQATVSRGSASV